MYKNKPSRIAAASTHLLAEGNFINYGSCEGLGLFKTARDLLIKAQPYRDSHDALALYCEQLEQTLVEDTSEPKAQQQVLKSFIQKINAELKKIEKASEIKSLFEAVKRGALPATRSNQLAAIKKAQQTYLLKENQGDQGNVADKQGGKIDNIASGSSYSPATKWDCNMAKGILKICGNNPKQAAKHIHTQNSKRFTLAQAEQLVGFVLGKQQDKTSSSEEGTVSNPKGGYGSF